MDDHINRHILENFGVTSTQSISSNETNKGNAPGVLRGIEGGALHFITVSGRDQEYIDHTLLNPEYISTHIPNGFIIDFIANQDGNESQQQPFMNESLPSDIVFHNDEQDRKLTASFLQLVNKQSPTKIPNEAPVIVTNKDMATLTPIIECNKQTSDDHNFLSMEEQQQLTQTLLNDHQFKLYQPTTATQSSMINLPLPPLTPIRRPNVPSKTITVDSDIVVKKEFYDNLDDLNSNDGILATRIASKSQKPLAKKSLPHKKRIPKKLKLIDRNEQERRTVMFQDIQDDDDTTLQNLQFSCQLCGAMCESQIDFFSHLKAHYEPTSSINSKKQIPSEQQLPDVEINFVNFSDESLHQTKDMTETSLIPKDENNREEHHTLNKETLQADEVEFSDTEDMLEGIRGVVDKVQESVDNDSNDDMDIINDKTWYNNSALNGSINFKTDIVSTNNQNLSTAVENFSAFFRNELEKQQESEQNVLVTVQDDKDNLDNHNTADDTKSPTIINDIKNESEISKLSDHNPIIDSKNNQKMEIKSLSIRSQKKSRTKKSKKQNNDSDDSMDDLFDMDSSDNDTKGRKNKIKCPKCNKLFNSTNALKYHDLSHTGERPHQCEVCGKSFFALSALKVHTRLHSGDKPYECEICKRAFRQWGDLKYHVISIHTNVKNFQCEFCGKAFARRYSLVIHRRIHTSERNYKCEFCSKTFRASSYLQNHRKVHTGEKPYPCKICGKKFRVSGDLKRHVNIHSRDKTKRINKSLPNVLGQLQPQQNLETFIITEVNAANTENEPSNIEMTIVKEENKLIDNNMDNDLVYSDENIGIFKNVAELDSPSLLESIPIDETSTDAQNLKKTSPINQTTEDKIASTRKCELDKTLANKSTDDNVNNISVDLTKFLPKGANFVYFW